MEKNLKVVVVCGGISTEREVSLRSGQAIFQALKNKGYGNAMLFDLTQDNIHELLQLKPDMVFLGLHGKGGEDGSIQGVLDLAGIPYTGSGVASSAVCMNKILTKRLLHEVGLPTAPFMVFDKTQCGDIEKLKKELSDCLGLPMVLKSPCQGSSIGVVIARDLQQIADGLKEVFRYGNDLLAEKYLDGVELTVPILGNASPVALPVIEITSEREFYDYTAKYTSGLCHHIIPARIDHAVEEKVKSIALETYHLLGCRGLSRIDFIVDKKLGPMVVEVNTLPGMTDMSLFPDAASYAGISYDDLVEKILLLGMP
jgi:D-alanine-D-alanine ligase